MVITIILTIILFMILVIPHEFGHMVAAKKMGVKVNEFAVGMGPALWKKQKGETLYSLRAIPLGGYTAMEGEDEEGNDDPRAFGNAAWWRKLVILFAGAFNNILVALITIIIAVAIMGLPTNQLSSVDKTGPAYQAGIRQGDEIVSVNGTDVSSWGDTVTQLEKADPTAPVKIVVNRDGDEKSYSVAMEKSDDGTGRYIIGIQAGRSRNVFKCVYYGGVATWELNKSMLKAFGQLFSGKLTADDVSGPVGLVTIVDKARANGIVTILYLVALVSLNLAVVNLLPLPALDGGRILFVIVRKLSGNRITDAMEGYVHLAGMAILFALFIFITWHDITKLL